MRRITPWIIGASSLLVILVASLGLISAWGAKTFLTKGINVGLDGIVNVIRTGEATLGRFDNIVSETLPTTIAAVESILASDRETSRDMTMTREEKAVLALRNELLPELDQVNSAAETISQIILSAKETLMFINTLPLIQLPELPAKRWQSLNNRLSALRENAQGLVDLLMRSENSGFMVKDAEIRRNVQTLKIISQELEDKLVEIKADLRTVLEKIEVVRAKITSWITWVSMGIFLVLLWITGGQIYLLWHFWHTRSKTLSPEE